MDKFPQYFHVAQLSQVVHDYTIGKHVHGQKIGKPQVAEGITIIFVASRTELSGSPLTWLLCLKSKKVVAGVTVGAALCGRP
jgi:hypothetical protein